MSSERTARWLRCAWIAGIAAFLAVSVMPLSRSPLPGVEMGDKIAHFGVFFVLALFPVVTGAVRVRTVFFVLLLLAITSESLQALVPFRSFEGADLVADILGLLSGFAIGAVLAGKK
ncbi:MAG TPA: VanZ family protein [Synergistales bacterium]|nr:VanZ family protein [Synergistales bacterium]